MSIVLGVAVVFAGQEVLSDRGDAGGGCVKEGAEVGRHDLWMDVWTSPFPVARRGCRREDISMSSGYICDLYIQVCNVRFGNKFCGWVGLCCVVKEG